MAGISAVYEDGRIAALDSQQEVESRIKRNSAVGVGQTRFAPPGIAIHAE
jgi:hypothetical protein